MAGVPVGLSDIYVALLTKDDDSGVDYAATRKLAAAITAKISPKVNSATLFADDGPDEVASALGEITVEISVKDVDLDDQAYLLGHEVVGGVLTKKSTDVAPYVALGFKSLKSNKKYRYVWLYKGKFQLQEQEYKTQEDTPEFHPPTLTAVFVKRQYDDAWQKMTDEDHPDYDSSVGANWFTAVTGAAPDALTCTVAPTDGQTDVAVDVNVTWTYNNPIQVSDVTSSNFMLLQGGSQVEGVLSIDEDHKVVTFNPTANLSSSQTTYIAVASDNVRDIYGQKTAGASVTDFVTIA